jgi:Ras-related protein Rab-21
MILVGESRVENTAIAKFATSGEVLSQSSAMIGAAHYVYPLPDGAHMSIWDTAGQEQFHPLVPLHVRGAEIALLVFNVTSPASFESISEWARRVRTGATDCVLYIVGNKIDFADRQQTSGAEGRGVGDALCGAGYYWG